MKALSTLFENNEMVKKISNSIVEATGEKPKKKEEDEMIDNLILGFDN